MFDTPFRISVRFLGLCEIFADSLLNKKQSILDIMDVSYSKGSS